MSADIHGCDQRSATLSFSHPKLPHPISLEQHGATSDGFVPGTSSVIWPSARLLSEYLCEAEIITPEVNVVELGAGLGLVGLTAASLGACSVLLTDDQTEILFKNAKRSGLTNVKVSKCLWGECSRRKKAEETYDLILGSDLIYNQGFNLGSSAAWDPELAVEMVLVMLNGWCHIIK
ncbi:hypothetical protein CYMTET_19938 [Cymbomonas tetramitiformis]|uniref:Uncharacterized protein n=1 Tax=Cymbomonas tetramitiformis TaxID=36881 RepID=A0AAE0G506_9CHLO|nr:hypothetical protein CYMTET_19938 [Cymbomonas tetramitiformis]